MRHPLWKVWSEIYPGCGTSAGPVRIRLRSNRGGKRPCQPAPSLKYERKVLVWLLTANNSA